MCLTEYNEEETMELFYEDGKTEGKAEGKAENTLDNIKELMKNMKWTAEQAMSALGIPVNDQNQYTTLL